MTFAPASIKGLAAYLVAQGFGNSGIVGDAAHQARASYHNGQDAITAHGRTAANDYTIRTARDREPHLTDAASALDIGRGTRPLGDLQALSRWFVDECRRNAPGTDDVREFIYSPDGSTVLRWDRERGFASAPQTGEADSSHLWHTHISFYRDSEAREKVTPWRGYFQEAPMIQRAVGAEFRAKAHTAFPAGNGVLRDAPSLTATILDRRATGSVIGTVGEYVDPAGNRWRQTAIADKPAWLLARRANGTAPDWEAVADPSVDAELDAFIARQPDPTPFSQADLDAATLAGRQAEWDRVTAFSVIVPPAKP